MTAKFRKLPENTDNYSDIFISELQNFHFAPPSDNLWTIEFHLADRNGSLGQTNNNLLQLYTNVLAVNEKWDKLNGKSWSIKPSSNDDGKKFITKLCESKIGIFLAQNVNFSPLSINYDAAPFGEMQQHGSFFKNAKVVKSRKDDDSLKIGFLTSNWDIGDILIEPWMAAIAQYGLIETSEICIKAKIIVTEYSTSRPKNPTEEDYGSSMQARKQYIFNNCFPISRDEIKKNYDQNDAGTYKTQVVSFVYDTYQLSYKF